MGNRSDQFPELSEESRIEYLCFLVENGYRNIRLLPGNRWVAIMPFMFTQGVITGYIGDRTGFNDRWCYENFEKAYEALDNWDGTGEPVGWHRHPTSGRRRPNGIAEEEYINL